MALTVDWAARVVLSDASITDLVVFHQALRALEASPTGELYPTMHTWRALALGGGAYFYQADFVNGWQLKFSPAGQYLILGNLNASIVPLAGVYVERKTSAAYVTTAIGGSGPTAAEVAAAVRANLAAELALLAGPHVPADVRAVNGRTIKGSGVAGDTWGPA